MGHATPVSTDYPAGQVRRIPQRAKDASQARRLLAIAAVLEGAWREEAAKMVAWIVDPAGLGDPVQRAGTGRSHQIPSPGVPPSSTPCTRPFRSNRRRGSDPLRSWRRALAGVRSDDAAARAVRALSVGRHDLSRPQELGFSHMSARPEAYKQNAEAMAAFKKTSPSVWRKSARHSHPAHVRRFRRDVGWSKEQAHLSLGQKGWRRATHNQRTQSTYRFGAVCPERGAGAALVLPACNCEAMQLHLGSNRSRPPEHTHSPPGSGRLAWRESPVVPSNLSPAAAATCARTQRPGKHWQFIRQNWLSNRIFKSFDDIVITAATAGHTHRPTLEDHVHRATRLGTVGSRSEDSGIGRH